jgi:hypothetical protein
MGKVVVDMSMSLDGFVRATGATPERPLGEGGERLHEWVFGGDERDREVVERASSEMGAGICGRNTYDDSLPFWGAHGRRARNGPRCSSSRTRRPPRAPKGACTRS